MIIVIHKTFGGSVSIKIDETGTLQRGGSNVMDKVPNILIDEKIHDNIQSGHDSDNTGGGRNSLTKKHSWDMIKITEATKKGYAEANEGDSINFSVPNSKTRRGRVGVGVAQTLDTQSNQGVIEKSNIRRLTEIEVERLQGYQDNWTKYGNYDGVIKEISRTQRYKLCGNAITRNMAEIICRKLLKNIL